MAIARTLDLPEQHAQEQQQIILAVKHWLKTHNDWLLIVDNADDVKIASELTPLLSGDARVRHLLFTTRAPFAQQVEIKEMSLTEGEDFLLRRAVDKPPGEEDCEMARKITRELGGLPLALDQAGAYIRETQCGLADYLERYRTHAPKLMEKRGTLAMAHDHPESVAKTGLLSFENIANENPAAAELLRLCAFLHPDNIPEDIFTKGAEHLGDVLAPVAADVVELDDARRVILKYSLVSYAPTTKIWSIHGLVQLILKPGMDETAQRTWAERAVRAVESAFPDPEELSNWADCERLLPCAQTCAELIEEWELEFEEAAHLLSEKAEYAQAKPLYERALAIREKVHGKEHPSVATSLNNLAELYKAQSAYKQALPLYERALTIREKALGKKHPDVATSLNNLALLYDAAGEYEQAWQLHKRALSIRKKILGKRHPDVAESFNNLARLYVATGMYEEALYLYKRTLAIAEKVYGTEHIFVAQTLNNLALLYYALGAYKRAKPLYERSLKIFNHVLKPEHPHVRTASENYAIFLKDLEKQKTTTSPNLWARLRKWLGF